MIIGIDVGGTHADGVLLQGCSVVTKKKVAVNHNDLTASLLELLTALLPERRGDLQRIHLSTTLCTNALITGKVDEVGMAIQAGPGMNPDFLKCGEHMYFADGAIDHRGQEVKRPSFRGLPEAVAHWREQGIASVGIVTKFSHRNNAHELLLQRAIEEEGKGEGFTYISLGHCLSGMPNFPRRVYTTWLNGALKSPFERFKEAMEKSLAQLGVTCPVYILKADGGTMPFRMGCSFPCQAVHSGPSASVMGALALQDGGKNEDLILLDIGGTTTDIALFAEGTPLLEPYGATVAGRPTLIRALLTKSVGLGGDSSIFYKEREYVIGPQRQGSPMALGGMVPTPTDAMVVLGKLMVGEKNLAVEAMRILRPDQEAVQTAGEVLHRFACRVAEEVGQMIDEVFSRPVYTVTDFLDRAKLTPARVVVIGGPAQALCDDLQQALQMECRVPEDYEVANAIGVARARLTVQASLYADTGLGTLSIPELSLMEDPGRRFNMEDAEGRLQSVVCELAHDMGMKHDPEVDFIERLELNTVRGFSSTGKIFALKAQIRPGLEPLEQEL